MIANRIAGGCLAAASFVLFGLVLLVRMDSPVGVQLLDRLGPAFALVFIGVQAAMGYLFLGPRDLAVPGLLLVGGTVLFALVSGLGGGPSSGAAGLHHALFAGGSFSGLALGALVMMGERTGEGDGETGRG